MGMDKRCGAAQLRQDVLHSGLAGRVCLAEVDSFAELAYPTVSLDDQQQITLHEIRSILTEGLFTPGTYDTVDGHFAAFDEPLDQIIDRIQSVYVSRYHHTTDWAYRFWFSITDNGRQAAMSTKLGREIAQEVADERRLRALRRQHKN